MVLDEETLERMLASSKGRREPERVPAALTDATDEFEVYERPAPPEPEEPAPQAPQAQPAHAPPAPQPPAPQAPVPPPAQPPAQPDYGASEYPPRQHAPPAQPPAHSVPAQHVPPPAHSVPAQQQPPQSIAPPAQPAPPAPQAPPAAPAQTPQPTAPARPQVFNLNKPASQPASASTRTTAPGNQPRIAIVQSDYNADVTDLMAQWATKHAASVGAPIVHHAHVPGVYDIPLTAKMLAKRDDVDAIVVLGCVVQGETGHDELITRETARLMADLAYTFEKPVGLGVAGPRMTTAQAEARIKMGRNAVESVLRQYATIRGLTN